MDEVVASELVSFGVRQPRVLPHFVADEPPKARALPDGKINVLHAGSVALSDPDANLENLLHPFEAALLVNPKLHLHLLGRLTVREEMLVRASSASSCISIHGTRPLHEALSWMAGADALIFLASSKMHVPPSKITDYLQFDVPIIACGTGDWRRDPRVPVGDPQEMLERLAKGDKQFRAIRPPTATAAAQQMLELMAQATR